MNKKIIGVTLLMLFVLNVSLTSVASAYDNEPPKGSLYNSGDLEDSSG